MSDEVATEPQSIRKLLLSNLNWIVGANLACGLVSFASTIWFARTLGPQVFGEYAVIVTALQILTAFLSPGFNQAVIRSPHKEDLVGAASVGTAVQSLLLLTVSAIGYVVYYALAPDSASMMLGPGALIVCGIALSFFMYLLSAPFEAQINYRFLGWIRLTTLVLSVGTGMAVASDGHGLYALAVRDLLSTGLMLAAVSICSPLKLRWHCSKDGLKELWHFSSGLWGLNILERVTLRLDYAAVGWLFGKEALGIYFAMRNLVEGTTAFLLAPIQTVVYSALCRFNLLVRSFQKLLQNAFGFLWLSIFAVGIAYVLSSMVVTSLFGERYHGGEAVVAGLALYACAVLWFELMKTFAMSRNRHHSLVVARATQMAFSIILIYPLTQLAGLSGAGFTTGIAALAMACVATVFAKQVVLEEAVKQRKDAAIQPESSEDHSRMSEYWLVPVRPYLIAGLMGIVTISLRLAMDPVFGPYYNFSPLLLGLMHIAWNYGLRPAQAYFGLTLAGSVYFFIPPRGAWLVTTTVDVLALACYVVFAVIVMMFVEHKRRTGPSPQGAGLSLGVEPNEQVQAKALPRRERGHLKAVND